MATAKFCGVDFWSAANFKTESGHYFCCLELLIDGSKDEAERQVHTIIELVNSGQLDLHYKGRNIDDDPIGPVKGITLSPEVEFS